ncbi:hypothetical protein XENTR_v10009678 [Xenopus tropicalis]|nr:hypothetical protein XENTR_v10009678 [Xenopus tropicalis]
MENRNNSKILEFIIVGFSDFPGMKIPLFFFFLSLYNLTLIGNVVLILVICWSPSLYTPMYFFLCNLSSLDIVYTSVTSPKLIHIFVTSDRRISFRECIAQLYFFVAFGSTEYLLLTVMSYDRYVAVCKPLHYPLIMNRRVCTLGATGAWVGGILASLALSIVTSNLNYCASNMVNHIFCDIIALVQLSCGETIYIHNIILIQGRYKAFSTCASHLTVVSLFYLLVLVLYMGPESTIISSQSKILVVLYAYFIPLLNPVVYSFRNKEVKGAIEKMLVQIRKASLR